MKINVIINEIDHTVPIVRNLEISDINLDKYELYI
jgi:hypothetical protein